MSNYFGLLQAVFGTVQPTIIGLNVVGVRKKVIALETDNMPMLCIAPGVSGEKIHKPLGQTMKGPDGKYNVIWDYPVVLAIISNAQANLSSDLQPILDNRELLRNQLYQMQPILLPNGVTAMPFNMSIDMSDAIAESAFSQTNYDLTGIVMTYQIPETRLT